ncbi:hypothetical protein CC78DRAFT_574125 [Lojkania enalia]|uniref:Uncharacterized protein n=1 Tax=Lojkania enalia TaxID=147567 RepID=A0A9P4NB72_9PLEO|nr:hypothetical protein CC78DRAFT_574125 [Didymosphaeria enalia]
MKKAYQSNIFTLEVSQIYNPTTLGPSIDANLQGYPSSNVEKALPRIWPPNARIWSLVLHNGFKSHAHTDTTRYKMAKVNTKSGGLKGRAIGVQCRNTSTMLFVLMNLLDDKDIVQEFCGSGELLVVLCRPIVLAEKCVGVLLQTGTVPQHRHCPRPIPN